MSATIGIVEVSIGLVGDLAVIEIRPLAAIDINLGGLVIVDDQRHHGPSTGGYGAIIAGSPRACCWPEGNFMLPGIGVVVRPVEAVIPSRIRGSSRQGPIVPGQVIFDHHHKREGSRACGPTFCEAGHPIGHI